MEERLLLSRAQPKKNVTKTHKIFVCLFWILLISLAIPLHPVEVNSQQRSRGLKKAPDKPQRFYNRVYALTIGINEYQSASITALKWAEKDALEVAKIFDEVYGYETQTLIGRSATKTAILNALKVYEETLTPDDALIIFFAGHGQTIELESFGRAGFILPYDSQLDFDYTHNLEQWEEQAIAMTVLGKIVESMPARHVLLLTDTCYSGFFGKRSGIREERPDLDALIKRRSRMVITAGTEDQVAIEDDESEEGIFTGELLNLLRNKKAQSASELFISLRKHVSRRSNKNMLPQLREVAIDNGEFVFIPQSVDFLTAVKQIASRILRMRGRQTTLTQLFEVINEVYGNYDYRFATDAHKYEKAWKEKCQRFQDNATLSDPLAMVGLHICFDKGLGIERVPEEALKWAREAYDTGHIAGQYALARSYQLGIGTTRNPSAANNLYQQAANGNFAPAKYQLALDMTLNVTEKPNANQVRDAIDLFEKAMSGGFIPAINSLGKIYADSHVTIDKALKLLSPIAENGYPDAQFALFRIYSRKDTKEAKKWLESAAHLGHAEAQFFLARSYYTKRMIEKQFPIYRDHPFLDDPPIQFEENLIQSQHWAEISASQNFPPAHYLLCIMYELGQAVSINYNRARHHCEMAVESNYTPAITRKGKWYFRGTLYEKSFSQAMSLFTQAALSGDSSGMAYLGLMYGLQNQASPWLYWTIKASKLGHIGATDSLNKWRVSSEEIENFLDSYPDESVRLLEDLFDLVDKNRRRILKSRYGQFGILRSIPSQWEKRSQEKKYNSTKLSLEQLDNLAQLVDEAKKQEGMLNISPFVENSASEIYKKILKIAPKHQEALKGIERIKEQFVKKAAVAEYQNEWKKASENYELSLILDPKNKELQSKLKKANELRDEKKLIDQNNHMVRIPGGEFWFGCNVAFDDKCQGDEMPGKKVYLEAFFIDKYEVSVEDFVNCAKSGVCQDGYYYGTSDRRKCNVVGARTLNKLNHPMNCVNWEQAKRYCEAIGKRLPTEAEWEKAARGPDGLIYPWGNNWDPDKANVVKSFKTAPVDSYSSGVSPYGVYHMSGNVSEWVEDWYTRQPQVSPPPEPKAYGYNAKKVVRGGSMASVPSTARASSRHFISPKYPSGPWTEGFRCAK